jgi:hypothetical protein
MLVLTVPDGNCTTAVHYGRSATLTFQ